MSRNKEHRPNGAAAFAPLGAPPKAAPLCSLFLLHKGPAGPTFAIFERVQPLQRVQRVQPLHRVHKAPQVHKQPQENLYVHAFSDYFKFLKYFLDFWSNIKFLVEKTRFFYFSKQSHAETSRNVVKNSVLDPKHAKLNRNFDFGHVRTCQGQSRRTSPCQQSWLFFFVFLEIAPFRFLVANSSFCHKNHILH